MMMFICFFFCVITTSFTKANKPFCCVLNVFFSLVFRFQIRRHRKTSKISYRKNRTQMRNCCKLIWKTNSYWPIICARHVYQNCYVKSLRSHRMSSLKKSKIYSIWLGTCNWIQTIICKWNGFFNSCNGTARNLCWVKRH